MDELRFTAGCLSVRSEGEPDRAAGRSARRTCCRQRAGGRAIFAVVNTRSGSVARTVHPVTIPVRCSDLASTKRASPVRVMGRGGTKRGNARHIGRAECRVTWGPVSGVVAFDEEGHLMIPGSWVRSPPAPLSGISRVMAVSCSRLWVIGSCRRPRWRDLSDPADLNSDSCGHLGLRLNPFHGRS